VAGIAIGPKGGERVERAGRRYRIVCELPELEVIEARFGADFEGVEPHAHGDHADCFYVLNGEAEFTLDGEIVRAGSGSFIAAPIGTLHGFRNAADGELIMLNVHAPGVGFTSRLRAGRATTRKA
jgi:mannose-6-phosphate isomerase-like protein (cupin superfamily)